MWVLANVLVKDSAFRIVELDISMNKLGDVGARAIGLALNDNLGLVMLAAESIGIGDGGCTALAAGLAHNSVLHELRLAGNQFGRDAVASLIQAIQQQQQRRHARTEEDQAESSVGANAARGTLRICDVGAAVGGDALLAALR